MFHASITRLMALALLASTVTACGASAGEPGAPTAYPFITATPQPAAGGPATVTLIATPSQATTPIAPTGAPVVLSSQPVSAATTPTVRAAVACRYQPPGLFAAVYQSDPGLPPSLGCAVGRSSGERPQLWPVTIDFQPFERGYMLWISNQGWLSHKTVLVMLDDNSYSGYDDTFNPTTDQSSNPALVTPSGLYQPLDALGKVWRTQPGLSARIGYATALSSRDTAQMAMFDYGQMIDIPLSHQVMVLKLGQPGSWSLHPENQ